MKKIYSKPECDIVKVELANMIALSLVEDEANPEGEVLSRHGDWDDEEWDDEEW